MARVLLVDDEDDLRRMLRLMLAKLGHYVIEARNGVQALEKFKAEPPDVVLSDLMMPEKEGLETIEEMRKLQPNIRIVAMSGGGRINAREVLTMAKYLGAHHVLQKPFTAETLATTITAALER